jgi:predicted DNA-binding transcriptional regulator YafY
MGEEDLSMLPVVQEALACDHKLTFTYTKADGETSARTVEPLGMVCKQAAWYLVARTPAGMRTFRVSRMRDALVLALGFKRPSNFDLAVYWKHSTATFKEQRQRFIATLALAPEAVGIIEPWCAMTAAPKHSASRALPEKWQIFAVEFESPRQARFAVLGLGSGAKALGPDEFVLEIRNEIARIVEK